MLVLDVFIVGPWTPRAPARRTQLAARLAHGHSGGPVPAQSDPIDPPPTRQPSIRKDPPARKPPSPRRDPGREPPVKEPPVPGGPMQVPPPPLTDPPRKTRPDGVVGATIPIRRSTAAHEGAAAGGRVGSHDGPRHGHLATAVPERETEVRGLRWRRGPLPGASLALVPDERVAANEITARSAVGRGRPWDDAPTEPRATSSHARRARLPAPQRNC